MSKKSKRNPKTVTAVDLFCGAGGMSSGLLEAFHLLNTRCKLTAINHWPTAVETHSLNHPKVHHICEDISNVNPRKLFSEGEVQVLVGGPSCTTHSSARGGRPLDCDQDRATPWCMVRWAESTLPEVIVIENVEQFQLWGPLIKKRCAVKTAKPSYQKWSADRRKIRKSCTKMEWDALEGTTEYKMQWVPDKTRERETFLAWTKCFEALGYKVDWKVLCTANYGDPTTRRRLFIMATRGKRKPVWPNPTHHENPPESNEELFSRSLRPWIPTYDIVDWTLTGKSIFNRRIALVDKTMRRVWIGFKKFALPKILEAERERQIGYIVPNFGERETQIPRSHSLDKPAPAVTSHGAGALVSVEKKKSYLIKYKGTGTAEDISKPITTLQASGKHHGLAQVELHDDYVVRYHGQSNAESILRPLSAVEAKAQKHGLAQSTARRKAFITELGYGEKNPNGEAHRIKGLDETLGTVTGSNNWYVAEGEFKEVTPLQGAPFLIQVAHGNDRPSDDNRRARDMGTTMPAITGSPEWAIGKAEITPREGFLLHTNHGDTPSSNNNRVKGLNTTFPTVCGNRGEVALATPEVALPAYVTTIGKAPKKKGEKEVLSINAPAPSITNKDKHALIEGTASPCNGFSIMQSSQKEVTYYKTAPSKGEIGCLIEFDPDKTGLPKTGKFFVQVLTSLYEVDIKLRMFEPHELSLAQGFPKSYKFVGNKTQQVKQIGNAVPRRTVRALILAAWSQNPNIPFIEDSFDDLPATPVETPRKKR